MESLERQVETLEHDMKYMRDDITAIKSNYATKTDVSDLKSELHKAIGTQAWKMVGAIGLMTTVFAAIVKWAV